jgi:hypothetical protein
MLVEPALYGLENMLMLPTGDPTLLGGGAAVVPVGNLIWLAKDRESGDAVVP